MTVFFSLAPCLIDFNKASLSFALLFETLNKGGGGAAGARGGGGGGAGIMEDLQQKCVVKIMNTLNSLFFQFNFVLFYFYFLLICNILYLNRFFII